MTGSDEAKELLVVGSRSSLFGGPSETTSQNPGRGQLIMQARVCAGTRAGNPGTSLFLWYFLSLLDKRQGSTLVLGEIVQESLLVYSMVVRESY